MHTFPHDMISEGERRLFARLDAPWKIQDYLIQLPFNHEKQGDTCLSPRGVMERGHAHCLEGALFAAAALWFHGEAPLLMDLKSGRGDDDHVVTLFTRAGGWGAISKTTHAVLRYRDPVYATPRELAMSYFHEYFLNDSGRKTLRTYSEPFDLSKRPENAKWVTAEHNLFSISRALDRSLHHPFGTAAQMKLLRLADPIERKAGKMVEK